MHTGNRVEISKHIMYSKTSLTFIKSIWEALAWVLMWLIVSSHSILGGHQVLALDVLLVLVVGFAYGSIERTYYLARLKSPKSKPNGPMLEIAAGVFYVLCVVIWANVRAAGWPDASTILFTIAPTRFAYFFISALLTPRPLK